MALVVRAAGAVFGFDFAVWVLEDVALDVGVGEEDVVRGYDRVCFHFFCSNGGPCTAHAFRSEIVWRSLFCTKEISVLRSKEFLCKGLWCKKL